MYQLLGMLVNGSRLHLTVDGGQYMTSNCSCYSSNSFRGQPVIGEAAFLHTNITFMLLNTCDCPLTIKIRYYIYSCFIIVVVVILYFQFDRNTKLRCKSFLGCSARLCWCKESGSTSLVLLQSITSYSTLHSICHFISIFNTLLSLPSSSLSLSPFIIFLFFLSSSNKSIYVL